MADKTGLIIDALAKVSKRPPESIKPEHSLLADLQIDSAKGLELLMELENSLNVEIPDEEAARIVTVKNIIDYVDSAK